MTKMHFPCYCLFLGNQPVGPEPKGPVVQIFAGFFVVSLIKASGRSCDVTVMYYFLVILLGRWESDYD